MYPQYRSKGGGEGIKINIHYISLAPEVKTKKVLLHFLYIFRYSSGTEPLIDTAALFNDFFNYGLETNIRPDLPISKIRLLNIKILLIFELLNFAYFLWPFAYFLSYLLPAFVQWRGNRLIRLFPLT